MKNWDDVSAQMQLNGTPLSALGYCRIAFDEGRGTHDLLKASFEDNATETIQLREKLTAQWQRAERMEQVLRAICDNATMPSTGDSSDPARVEAVHILRAKQALSV